MSHTAFGALISAADEPLLVVTAGTADAMAGCLVSFHCQSSMSPQQYCLWLSKANHTYRVGLTATHFAVHFLTKDDFDLAQHFGTKSGDDVDKFADIDFKMSEYGVPLLSKCANRMVVERISVLDDGGDHVCLTAGVKSANATDGFTPLRTSHIGNLQPGHATEEPPTSP